MNVGCSYHVLHGCASGCQTGRTHETDEETQNKQSRVVVNKAQWDTQDDEKSKCRNVGHISTEQRNFRQWAATFLVRDGVGKRLLEAHLKSRGPRPSVAHHQWMLPAMQVESTYIQ